MTLGYRPPREIQLGGMAELSHRKISRAVQDLEGDAKQRVMEVLNGYGRFNAVQIERALSALVNIQRFEEAAGRTTNSDNVSNIKVSLTHLRQINAGIFPSDLESGLRIRGDYIISAGNLTRRAVAEALRHA